MEELISIIVPIYKVEKYLSKCIESIINQTYKNIEIILVDDGSPDNCGIICDEYSKKDNRIKVIHKKNQGLSAARNSGLEIAKGKYISFVDSDDWIEKDMYEILINLAKKNNADISQCKFLRVQNEYEKNIIDREETDITILTNVEAMDKFYSIKNEENVNMIVVWNKLYRRDLFKNLRFDVGRIHEDLFIMHKLFFYANKIVTISKKLYFYRITENSITNNEKNKLKLDEIEAYEERLKFFIKIGENELVKKTIRVLIDVLIDTYYVYLKYDYKNIETINYLKSKVKDIYKLYFSFHVKIPKSHILFRISPKVYGIINKKNI